MKLILLDGYSLMYRAYHALSTAPMSAPDGTPTTAIHGFMMMLMKIIEDESPDLLAVAFDASRLTFRNDIFDGYKSNRASMPDDMRPQDPLIRELIERMGITLIEKQGYEADDILGTLSKKANEAGMETLIVTGDRDSFQLIGEGTKILYTRKGITDTVIADEEYIRERYGVTPAQLIDVKALMGDSSDNIPGISGIGEKTALRLISQYGDLESALAAADTGEKGKLRERLMEGADTARMCYTLAKIDRGVPLETDVNDLKIGDLSGGAALMRQLGMNQALKRLEKLAGSHSPARMPAAGKAFDASIETFDDINAFRARCDGVRSDWVSIAVTDSFHLSAEGCDLKLTLGGGDLLTAGIEPVDGIAAAKKLLDGAAVRYVCSWRIKGDFDDVALMAYCVNPQRRAFTAAALSEDEGIYGVFEASPSLAIKKLADIYLEKLKSDGMLALYTEIEKPLAKVLRGMEEEGCLIDADALRKQGEEFRAVTQRLEGEFRALAGDDSVNINSPKQLSSLLFEKMGLPKPKKTSQGYSTSAEVLENLAPDYPICAVILEYRKYKKLESTYIDALIRLRDPNGRVHTSFDQTGTATGRLSSFDPNLQNIPVRTELGKGIRAAFIAGPGNVLVDADYSQIELRVLAALSGDEAMTNAFNSGLDIHRTTAAEVHSISPEEVTAEMRSAAKAVNFGIVYGISDFTLAKNTGVSRAEARRYIDLYFSRYPKVKEYLDAAVNSAREKGYAETYMGRRRYIPELASANFNVRAFGERCAMNSPIQGTAADIIKLAMIKVAGELARRGLSSKLILQVHDELLIEAPESEAAEVESLLRECMESVVELPVKIVAEVSSGSNWLECK